MALLDGIGQIDEPDTLSIHMDIPEDKVAVNE